MLQEERVVSLTDEWEINQNGRKQNFVILGLMYVSTDVITPLPYPRSFAYFPIFPFFPLLYLSPYLSFFPSHSFSFPPFSLFPPSTLSFLLSLLLLFFILSSFSILPSFSFFISLPLSPFPSLPLSHPVSGLRHCVPLLSFTSSLYMILLCHMILVFK